MVTKVTDSTCLAGDFSGVLRVKTAGKAQEKRLRARSFLLEVLEADSRENHWAAGPAV